MAGHSRHQAEEARRRGGEEAKSMAPVAGHSRHQAEEARRRGGEEAKSMACSKSHSPNPATYDLYRNPI